jgi:hypothetical protein
MSAFRFQYMRYMVPGELRCDSLEDAIGAAWASLEDNTAWPRQIVDENDNVVLNHEALRDAIRALDERM